MEGNMLDLMFCIEQLRSGLFSGLVIQPETCSDHYLLKIKVNVASTPDMMGLGLKWSTFLSFMNFLDFRML